MTRPEEAPDSAGAVARKALLLLCGLGLVALVVGSLFGNRGMLQLLEQQQRARRLEAEIDRLDELFTHPTEFVVPGGDPVGAWLDLGRTVVRRAERVALVAAPPPSHVVPYLNRLSDLLWTMARWHEGTSLLAREG